MLNDDFYKILRLNINGSCIDGTLELNENHRIFTGHFPNGAVVPGVCMMHMVTELTGLALKRELQITAASDLKFLMVIDPNKNKLLQISILVDAPDDGTIRVTSTLSASGIVCFKFSGALKVI